MILRTRSGAVEVRSANIFREPPVTPWSQVSSGGSVEGLPAVLAAGRLISEMVAGMGQVVYRRGTEGSKTLADDAWQADLLCRRPNELMGPFEVLQVKVWNLIFHGAAYELKAKARGQVTELFPIDPNLVTVKRDGMRLSFEVRTDKGSVRLTSDDVVYTRGLATTDPLQPVSLIEQASSSLRKQLHAETYQRRFYENDATPGGIITTDQPLTRDQRGEVIESWSNRHQGTGNAGRLAVLSRGASYQQIGISPRDAQFVESAKFNVQEVARIFGLWSGWLGDTEAQMASTLEDENRKLLDTALKPWIKRVLDAQMVDRDLFPGTDLYPSFDTDALELADMQTRFSAYLQARQGGWMSNNDIRRIEGWEPIDNGDDYQWTPVGGAPNLQPGQGGENDGA